jgi:hypothetical protein
MSCGPRAPTPAQHRLYVLVVRLPKQQPQRAVVVVVVYLVVGGAGATALLLFRGPFLGGVFALMWLATLTVPAAVLAHRPSSE